MMLHRVDGMIKNREKTKTIKIDVTYLVFIILVIFPIIFIYYSYLNFWSEADRQLNSYTRTKTEAAVFYIPKNYKTDKKEQINNIKIIMDVAKGKYGLSYKGPEKPKVFFTQENDNYYIDLKKPRLMIPLSGENRVGPLFFQLSGGKLPVWLSIGLELYWLDKNEIEVVPFDKNIDVQTWQKEASDRNLPDFGDEWFIPGFIDDGLSDDVLSISYAFVERLETQGMLSELVSLYLKEGTLAEAERRKAELWRDFAGGGAYNEQGYAFQYFYDTNFETKSGLYSEKIAFVITAEQGKYYFTKNGWTLDMARENVGEFENCLLFTQNWLEREYPGLITVMLHRSNVGIEVLWGRGFSGEIYIQFADSRLQDDVPHFLVHEAAHAISRPAGLVTNFPIAPKKQISYFEEGLATLAEFIYAEENSVLQEAYMYRLNNMAWTDTSDYKPEDVAGALDKLAFHSIDFYDFDDESLFGTRYRILQSYFTAASFQYYLLEQRGSKEDFFSFYSDVGKADEIYGEDLDSLIEDWQEYLAGNYR